MGHLEPRHAEAAGQDPDSADRQLRGTGVGTPTSVQGRLGRTGRPAFCDRVACLTLEIYYRYLPLYKVDAEATAPANAKK